MALVIDRDPERCARLRRALEERGVESMTASTAPEALEVLRTRQPRIVVVDLDAPGVVAADLIGSTRRLRPAASVVALAGADAGEAARAAVRDGAFDVQLGALDGVALRLMIERATRQSELLRDCERLRDELRGRAGFSRLVGRSAPMRRLRAGLERLAGSNVPVLFRGEAGSGKKLAARTLHRMSPWRDLPFVVVDCTRTPSERLAGELFGGPGGSGGPGLLRAPRSATVLLDAVGELSGEFQKRLDAVLREAGRGAPDGLEGGPPVHCASRDDLAELAERGRFREALLPRLASESVELPALRERLDDIPLLARHFIESVREINELPPIQLSPEAIQVLVRHSWPGNVGELRHAIEQAVILAVDGTIRPGNLPPRLLEVAGASPAPTVPETRIFKEAKREVVERFERGYLADILEQSGGNVTAAAQQAGMLRSALQRLLRKYDIRSADYRRRRKPRAH